MGAVSLPAPYYEDEWTTIYNADCELVLPHLSGIDMVFTSPPYNLGWNIHGGKVTGGFGPKSIGAAKLTDNYRSYDDAMEPADYEAWQTRIVHLCWETLSDDGAIFYNHKPRPSAGEMLLPTRFGDDLPLRQIIVWDRATGLNFSTRFFLPKHEWIVVWARPDWRLIDKSSSQTGDVWSVPPETRQDHPAPFPVELPRRAIAATDAKVVLDPFMGSGSTLRAAKDLGRRAIGIELDETYCELAVRRLSQEVLPFD